ncbi:MAG TPA: family 20 glycosylhydrolase [Thermoanaerobaculia bacterium]|nr:family 20 glycosylhydrolase [Thermoanaerobaculia bacterium]
MIERLLAPPPRLLERTGGAWSVPAELAVWNGLEGAGRVLLAARVAETLSRLGLRPRRAAEPAAAHLCFGPAADLPAQAYRLEPTALGWRVEAGDAAGAFYGLCTLAQWLELHRSPEARIDEAPWIRVEDAPSFPTRGVMLDVSRNRVPTMASLFELVDRFAALKLNHVQLYVEHTFAYVGHETAWRGWSPLTAEEIRALDDYCRERFVELVPNQNSFGHLHRWLVHDEYRHLAECPEGIAHPFGDEREPFSLCAVDPRSLDLLADLYEQLLPNFRSRLFNVGLDETFDLGRGRSAVEVAKHGKGRVYLDFLRAVHRLVEQHGRRMLFWGDIVLEHPELIPELPEEVLALEWGYEADHPFSEHGERFARSQREFWVCPGTSSWLSFAGRAGNALENLASAARNGLECGATGYLITDWGDQGHLQPLPSSFLGWVAGACFGWNALSAAAPRELPVAEMLDRTLAVHAAPGTGAAICDLGEVYRLVGPMPTNRSALFSIVQHVGKPFAGKALDAVDAPGLERAAAGARAVERRIGDAACGDAGELIRRELAWTSGALRLACELGIARLQAGRERSVAQLPAAQRAELRDAARALGDDLATLWLERDRPGGLDTSLRWWGRIERALGYSR